MRVNDEPEDAVEGAMTEERAGTSPWLTADEAAARICKMHGIPFVRTRGSDALTVSRLKARELTALRRRREELEEQLRMERDDPSPPSRLTCRETRMQSRVPSPEAVEHARTVFNPAFNVPLRSGITCNPAPAARQTQEKVATAGTGEDIPVKEKSKTVKTAKTAKTSKSAMDAMIKQGIAEAKISTLEGEVSGLRLALDSVMTSSATLAKCRGSIAPGTCKNAPDVATAASDLDQRLRELIASASAARNTCLNTIRRNSNE